MYLFSTSYVPIQSISLCKVECLMDGRVMTFKCIVCTGPHSWILPTVELQYPNKIEKYRWFARSLLEGLVMKKMKPFVAKYSASPSIMIKSWARYSMVFYCHWQGTVWYFITMFTRMTMFCVRCSAMAYIHVKYACLNVLSIFHAYNILIKSVHEHILPCM